MGLLKRLFGTTDAVEDARERAEGHKTPPGWNLTSPEFTQTADEVTLKMAAPGLDPEMLEHEIDGDTLVLKAQGRTDTGVKVDVNERIKLAGGGHLEQADVSYEDGKIVVRIPKSAFPPPPQSSA